MDWHRYDEIDGCKVRHVNIKDYTCHAISQSSLPVILQGLYHLGGCLLVGMKCPNLIDVGDRLDKVQFLSNQFLLTLVADDRKSDRAADCALRRIKRVKEAAQ